MYIFQNLHLHPARRLYLLCMFHFCSFSLRLDFLLFLLFRNVNTGYLGFENWNILKLPDGFYENLFTTYLGFPQKGFFSADYFSLLPWFFLFLTGFYLYQLVQKNHMMEKLFSWRVPGFDVIGRHSLLIYLLHQPAVFGISWMLFQI